MQDVFSLSSNALPATAHVVGLTGVEAVSRPYRFDVGVTLPNGEELDLMAAVGSRATLVMDRGPFRPAFQFHGIFASVELVHEMPQQALYVASLVPLFWQLTLTEHSRVFTDGTIPEIIKAVLEYSGLTSVDYSLRLSASYPSREHVCQYHESNFAFVSRLMEREGMYYYFEQGDDREVLVITDHVSFQNDLVAEPVKYFPISGVDVSSKEALHGFKCKVTSLPAQVKLKDYDYEKPSLDVSGSASIVPSGKGDIVRYGDNFTTPGEASRYAKIRAEQYLARQAVFQGKGRIFNLRPGYTFTLEDHPRASFNASYQTLELHHYGNQSAGSAEIKEMLGLDHDEVYRVEVQTIPRATQFRSEATTFIPRVYGVVDGVVDGEVGSPYAQIDRHGRYKVRIFFDESDLLDGKSSTWVRMLQPHGGSPEGFHFPLRKGTEVHIVFLGGDPDRPVIVGVGPNAQKPSPVVDKNHTLNVIQTGGQNRMEMEDTAGAQYMTLSSPVLSSFMHLGAGPYNFIAQTDGNGLVKIVGNYDIEVTGDMTEDVTGSVTETYLSTQDTTVTGAVTQTYESTQDITITGAVTETYESTQTTTVTAAVKETYEATLDTDVTGVVTQNYADHHIITVGAGRDDTITGDLLQSIDGNILQTISANVDQDIAGTYKQKVGIVDWFTKGNSFKVTMGMTSDTFIGLKNTNFIGGQLNMTIAAIANFKLSAELNFTMGVNTSIFLGVRTNISASVDIDIFAAIKLRIGAAVNFEAVVGPTFKLAGGPKVDTAPINLVLVGIVIIL